MKISIQGNTYPLFEAIGGAALGDLAKLNKRGVNVRSIKASFEKALKLLDDGGDGLDLYEDDDYIANMTGVVYLALRHAGHDVTIEDAERVPGAEVFLVMEDADADPKDEPDESLTTSTT